MLSLSLEIVSCVQGSCVVVIKPTELIHRLESPFC